MTAWPMKLPATTAITNPPIIRPRSWAGAEREITACAAAGYPAAAAPTSARPPTATEGVVANGRGRLATAISIRDDGSTRREARSRAATSHTKLPAPNPTANGSRKIAALLPVRPSVWRSSVATGTGALAEAYTRNAPTRTSA